MIVDHKNFNTLYNKKNDLRIVTMKQNMENRKDCQKNNGSNKNIIILTLYILLAIILSSVIFY